MNERITELDQIAYKYAMEKCPDYTGIQRVYANKFAELIIGECINAANTSDLGLNIVSTRIKEHFGVE